MLPIVLLCGRRVPASLDEITVPPMTEFMMRDCRSGNDGMHDEEYCYKLE